MITSQCKTLSTIFTKENNFCDISLLPWMMKLSKGSLFLKGKNLLLEEQILFFIRNDSRLKGDKENHRVASPQNVLIYIRYFTSKPVGVNILTNKSNVQAD